MGHHTCCNKQKVKRGLWSPEEDEKLINYISVFGHGCWSSVPKLAGLQRCGKSCRLRWINYLRPDLKRGSFTPQEASLIIDLHRILGNRWAQIAKYLPGRTDNEVKNFWNSSIKKKLISQVGLTTYPTNMIMSHNNNINNNNFHLNFIPTTTSSILSDEIGTITTTLFPPLNNPIISPNYIIKPSQDYQQQQNFVPNDNYGQINLPILQGFDPISSEFTLNNQIITPPNDYSTWLINNPQILSNESFESGYDNDDSMMRMKIMTMMMMTGVPIMKKSDEETIAGECGTILPSSIISLSNNYQQCEDGVSKFMVPSSYASFEGQSSSLEYVGVEFDHSTIPPLPLPSSSSSSSSPPPQPPTIPVRGASTGGYYKPY